MKPLVSTHSYPPEMNRPLRVLAITRIYPNRQEPLACPFQRRQFVALAKHVDLTVVAPIPYFPGASLLGNRARVGKLSKVPARDTMDGVPLHHPRALYLPRIGPLFSALNAPLHLAGIVPRAFAFHGRFDVVLGAYLFPDAWAAMQIAHLLRLPYVVKAHGTDVNIVARWPSVRPFIRSALRNASATIGVSRPMLDTLVSLGALHDRVTLVPNGVDRDLFQPRSRVSARKSLLLPEGGKILLFVGRLEKEKGIFDLVDAFEKLRADSISLVFLGDGSQSQKLAEKVAGNSRIILAGNRPPEQVALFLSACDALVLPSWAEGTPNVVLEALAAGRPVVATRVGGIPDVVTNEITGWLVPPRDIDALARAIEKTLNHDFREEEIVEAAPPGWDHSAARLLDVLEKAASLPQHIAATQKP